VTSDPGPGSNGFPLPPSATPPAGGLPSLPGYGPPGYGPPVPGNYGYGQHPGYGPYPYGPHPQPRQVQPGMLCAQADRDRTMDVLKSAYTEGRLTKNEFDERSARVLTARTYGDLHSLVGDLPQGPGGPALPVPYAPGYYSPQLAARTNGFAVGSLICGIVPFFGGIPAVILGHVARGQIKQTGERGDGLAISGLVLGYLWITLWALIILIGVANS